jgi:hypothetical protein
MESSHLPAPDKDRSTGLMVFGVLTILLGCVSGLFVPLILFGQMMSAQMGTAPTNFSLILPGLFVYGALAIVLVWLGIGSIRAQRWARAILLIFSWGWLVMGVLFVGSMAFILPGAMTNLPSTGAGHPAPPAGLMDTILAVMFLIYGVIFVVMPGIWTFFYSNRHVKATCEARHPALCWTDACPLPVLALCLWLAFSIPTMAIMPLVGYAVIPFFGMFVTGLPATLSYLALAVLWSYAAWLLYRLDLRGWWLILIVMCAFTVSNLLTYARHDVMEMYRLMNFPPAQLEQIQKSGILQGNRLLWLTLLFMLPFFGYLFFIKRYFRRSPHDGPGTV